MSLTVKRMYFVFLLVKLGRVTHTTVLFELVSNTISGGLQQTTQTVPRLTVNH